MRRRNSRWYSQYGRGESYGESSELRRVHHLYNPLGYGEVEWDDLPPYVEKLIGSEEDWERLQRWGVLYYAEESYEWGKDLSTKHFWLFSTEEHLRKTAIMEHYDHDQKYDSDSLATIFFEEISLIVKEWYPRIESFGTVNPSIGFNYAPKDPNYIRTVKAYFNELVRQYNQYAKTEEFGSRSDGSKLRLDPLTLNGIKTFWFALHLTSELGKKSPFAFPVVQMLWPKSMTYASLFSPKKLANATRYWNYQESIGGWETLRENPSHYIEDDYYDDEY